MIKKSIVGLERMKLKQLTAAMVLLCMVLIVPAMSHAERGESPRMSDPKMVGQTSIKGNREVLLNPNGPKMVGQVGIKVNREVLLNPNGPKMVGQAGIKINREVLLNPNGPKMVGQAGIKVNREVLLNPNGPKMVGKAGIKVNREVLLNPNGPKLVGQTSIKVNREVPQNPNGPGAREKRILQTNSIDSSGLSDTMVDGASKITGRVTGPDCVTQLESIYVEAYRWNGDYYDYAGGAYTAADGTYEIGGLSAGTYKIRFYDWSGNYLGEYYNNQPDEASAQEIVVGSEETVGDINACLEDFSKITGRVTGPDCVTQLESIYVEASRWNGDYYDYAGGAYTAADGTYEIDGLSAGTYKVEFYGDGYNYAGEYYNNQPDEASAQEIVVGSEETVGDINACLEVASKITGKVTRSDCETPVENSYVTASRWNGAHYQQVNGVYTAADGTYEIGGLSAGTYKVEFYGDGYNYAGEYYNNQTSFDSAQEIVVGAEETVGDINACLEDFSKITGKVTRSDCTTPVENSYVTAYRWNGAYYQQVNGAYTAADGTYEIGGLTAGTYKVEFYGDGYNYAGEYYNNQTSFDSAQKIAVGAEETVGDINACLEDFSKITGKVTGPDCETPVENSYVTAYRWNGAYYQQVNGVYTAADGTYEIGGLSAGTYKIRFYDWSGNYLGEYYNNQPDEASAQEIAVGSEETVGDINACLEVASKITGRVTRSDCTTPVENIQVYASRWNGAYYQQVNGAYTAADGTYEIDGLPIGTYKVEFYGDGYNYAEEYYNNQTSFESAQEIVVGSEETVGDINACLEDFSKISGTVTRSDCITPVENIQVYASRWNGDYYEWARDAYTAADGTYEIGGLSAGTYKIGFFDWSGNYAEEYYNNQTSFEFAQEIVVGAEETVGDIDACLARSPQFECSADTDCDPGKTCDNFRCVECLLDNSLDAAELTLETTSGLMGWFCQTEEFYYGDSAAQSGEINDLGFSQLSTTVTGPTVVSFYWKVSSEPGFDYLTFYIDDAEMSSISGEVGWQRMEYNLPAGMHTLKWQYSKDFSVSSELDCGWVDRLGFDQSGCETDGDCPDDGLFCNGEETCSEGACVAGTAPSCTGETPVCDENSDGCVECLINGDCPGGDECVNGACEPIPDDPPVIGDGPYVVGSWQLLPTVQAQAILLSQNRDFLWTFSDDFVSCSNPCTFTAEYKNDVDSTWKALTVSDDADQGTAWATLPIAQLQNGTYAFKFTVKDCAVQSTQSQTYYFKVDRVDQPPIFQSEPLWVGPWMGLSSDPAYPHKPQSKHILFWAFNDDKKSCTGGAGLSWMYRPVALQDGVVVALGDWVVKEPWRYLWFAWIETPGIADIPGPGLFEFKMTATDCMGQMVDSEGFWGKRYYFQVD